jgi:hypothetical protein
MSLIIGILMKDMGRDRNIAMDLGSNTNAAATIIRSVKRASLSHIKYCSIKENSNRTQWHRD